MLLLVVVFPQSVQGISRLTSCTRQVTFHAGVSRDSKDLLPTGQCRLHKRVHVDDGRACASLPRQPIVFYSLGGWLSSLLCRLCSLVRLLELALRVVGVVVVAATCLRGCSSRLVFGR